MATFRIPRPANQELGGNSDELVGQFVALRNEGTVSVNTTYGQQEAVRATAVAVTEDGYKALGLRLIYWSEIRKALSGLDAGEWIVGTVTSVPQASHPDRNVFVLAKDEEFTPEQILASLDRYEADEKMGVV